MVIKHTKFIVFFVRRTDENPASFQTWSLAQGQNSGMLITFLRGSENVSAIVFFLYFFHECCHLSSVIESDTLLSFRNPKCSMFKCVMVVARCSGASECCESLSSCSRIVPGTHPGHRGRHFLSAIAPMMAFSTLDTMHRQIKL